MMRPSDAWGLAALTLLALLVFCAATLVGPASIPLHQALDALFGGGDTFTRTIMQTLRLPRAIAAFTVGSLLGLSGVLLQALFRNPLADPFVLGVSGGAAVGALLGMIAGSSLMALHWYAGTGGIAIGACVLLLGRGGGSVRLLLCGVICASACGAMITVLLALADNSQLRGMVFWLAGDLSWAQYPLVDAIAALVTLAIALLCGRVLNVLAAGEVRSASVGLDGGLARVFVFVITAALVSLAVISAGTVGFVGLVAPHLVRLAFHTSDHRVVAPGAALGGGILLSLADMASRMLAAPRELPVGAVTALIGAPLFMLLLRRQA